MVISGVQSVIWLGYLAIGSLEHSGVLTSFCGLFEVLLTHKRH
jgi:hypothetical protein